MKQSLLEKASLPSPQYKEYLINYFFLGSNKSSEPDNWNQTVESIQRNLGWNRSLDSFNKFVSQVFLPWPAKVITIVKAKSTLLLCQGSLVGKPVNLQDVFLLKN